MKRFYNSAANCLLTILVLCWAIPGVAEDARWNYNPSAAENQLLSKRHAAAAPEACETIVKNGKVLTSCGIGEAIRYRLIEGSILIDECTICGRPPLIVPIRGSFWLELTEQNPLFSSFLVRGLTFTDTTGELEYTGQMEGTYQIGGEVVIIQQMTLKGRINNFEGLMFNNKVATTQVPFPWIEIDLLQVPPTDPLHTFSIHLVAVPWPRVLFSTETGFTSSARGMIHISNGDLLSSSGRVVRTNSELTARLGITPPVPDIGLDAVSVLPGSPPPLPGEDWRPCEILFSVEQNIFSERLGLLSNGDLLSSGGWIVRRNSDLIGPFAPQTPVEDYGLDAVAMSPEGLILFSIEEDFFSKSLGMSVGHGDLLREDGIIFKSGSELLAKFHPIEPRPIPFGLDAVYVWPNGEVWFSIEVDFADMYLGSIGHGDILSDIGRVVVRNKELIAPFKPLEKITDFGLDSLEVIWPSLAADFDYDGNVDFADLAIFASAWMSKPGDAEWNPDCDISIPADNSVDILDLAVLTEQWLKCVAP